MNIKHLPRSPEQRWVFLTDESPKNTQLFGRNFNGIFNWSMTYRSDSDVPVPYGRVVRSQSFSKPRNYHQEKEKGAAILVSNCHADSGRLQYLELLMKHLPVRQGNK